MTRDLILGLLHPDLACGIALGILESPKVTVTLEALTLFDPRRGTNRTQTGWLDGPDPLDAATRDYLQARRQAMANLPRSSQSGWAAASAVKARESANRRADQARTTAWQLLQERGVIDQARQTGLLVNPPG